MLQFGFGSADITPAVGKNIPGGFFPNPSKGVRDRLVASACVVHDGKNTVALVGLDSLLVPKVVVERARARIEKETKVPGAHVLLGPSHTHSGGPVIGPHTNREPDAEYLDQFVEGIVTAVASAFRSLHAGEVALGTGKEDTIAFNRRFLMRNGREITHPGKPGTPHHAEIVRPSGPIDPDVGVLAFRLGEKLAGVVVNYACHSTVVGGDQFSPDYAGYLRKHLRARYGDTFPVVFLLGACGDVTQVNNRLPGREGGPDYADMMGRKLAAEVERTLWRSTWEKEAPVSVATEKVDLTVRADPDVERERPAFGLGSGERIEPLYEAGRKMVGDLRNKTPLVPTEVQAIRIGPLGIVTNGSEFFADDGLRLKACSPFATTWVVTLANDWLGYVPPAQAFMGGGYESRTTWSSRFAIDSAQKLFEAGLRALGKVAAG
jgi:hypothetical protein